VEYVLARGGVLWIRSVRQRCCTGAMTSLVTSTSQPHDSAAYERVEGDLPFSVYLLTGCARPAEILVDMRGVRRKRPVAYWDGSFFRL